MLNNNTKDKTEKINWMAAIFVVLTEASTRLRQMLWRWVYNRIAQRDKSGNFIFMNYGYHDESKTRLVLQSHDEPYRYYIQLYDHVVNDIDMQNKNVLEVGCGRGGGGTYFLTYKNPLTYTGVDLSEKAIAWCNRHYQFVNANWKQGLADDLPILDNTMDILVNVESSHCYPSMHKFLKEAFRVLRLDGYMAFCDLRKSSGVEELDANIAVSGFQVIKRNDITLQVLNALDHISLARDKQIESVFPAMLRSAVRDFAAIKNTTIYNMLKTGEMKYLCYLLKKPHAG